MGEGAVSLQKWPGCFFQGSEHALPDHPDIARVLRTGWPDRTPPLEPAEDPRCPLCGQAAEVIVTDLDGQVVGCDGCLAFWEAGWYAVGERERYRGRV